VRENILTKIYRIVPAMHELNELLPGAEIWRKRVTVGESVRINEQLYWVAGLAEGQGGD